MNPIIISLTIFSVVHSHAMARQVPSGKVKGTNSQDSFIINDSVLIKTKDGATLSAIVVRKKGITAPLPAALVFTIYTDYEWNLQEAKQSAEHGFVGVVADARGKRLSPDEISPYENEVKDVNAVIDWIVQQSWSNGKV